MRLRTKFAIVLVIFALVLSGGVYGGLEIYKDRLVGDAQQEVNETAMLTADQIDATVKSQKDFIGFVASRPKAADFNQSDQYLSELVDNSRFFAAQVITANGTIVDFYGDISQDVRQESIGQDVSNRTYVRRALAGQVYMTDPEYANTTGNYLVIISAPIFEDREIKGVLAAALYVDRQTFFGTIGPLETTGQTVVVRDDDTVLNPPQHAFVENITAHATVDSTGWTVTVVRDRSDLIRQLRDLAIVQGVGLFVVLFAVILYGVWEYRTTLAQTEQLLDGFDELARGEFDTTLSLSAAEEWEQISTGFNNLAEELEQRDLELQRREQRLQVLNRALRHNLRNYTSLILGYAETIRDRSTETRITDPTNRLVDTAMDLIDLSDKARQIEAAMDRASSTGQRTPIQIVNIVDTVTTDIRTTYPNVDITLSVPDEAWAYGIPAIELAIQNVIENACQHNTAPDPHVQITVSTGDEIVEIRVADNGPGIPETERRVITEGRETALEHGSGLGLWLVYWTMERSQGHLEFDDNTPRGTIVTLELDRVPAEDLQSHTEDGLPAGDPPSPSTAEVGDPT